MKHSVLQYIEQPTLLSETTLEELQEQLARYPYSTNLRLLVLLKAKQVNDPAFESYLADFAAATFDRAHLYDLLRAVEVTEEAPGEVLELLQLEELELEPLASVYDQELPSKLNEAEASVPRRPPVVVPDPRPRHPEPSAVTAPSPPARRGFNAAEWVRSAATYSLLLPVALRLPRPEHPARFASTADSQRAEALSARLRKLRMARNGRAPGPATSGQEEAAVVSETLAALLVRQEQYGPAIRMYRRLILLYPEKKAIFAALIQELEEKL